MCFSIVFYQLNQDKKLYFNPAISKNVVLGSLGDNTFPCNLLGLKILIKNLNKFNKYYNYDITLKIAGKNKPRVKNIISKIILNSKINIQILDYIEDIPGFYKSINGLLVPVAGGSGIPIKIFDASFNYGGPIYTNKYVKGFSSQLKIINKKIYYEPEIFLEFNKLTLLI